MYIKREVKNLVVCAKFQQLAETRGYPREFAYYGTFVQQSLDDIDRWADMAEAAIALAEYQATSGYDPAVDGKTYTAERGRLWDAFVAARAKVKGANDGST